MTSPDKRHKNAGFPDRRLHRRRRQPARPAEYFGTSFHFRPRLRLHGRPNPAVDVSGQHDGRQRPRLAAAGDPRFQRRDGWHEHDRLCHPGPGVQTIAPISPLPAITRAVLIDGFSQPGYAGTPLIELSGSQAGSGDGLTITGPGVTVRGLDINSFSQGAGIHITGTGATGDWIYGNFLGTDPTGTQAEPNDYGVEIDGGPVTTSSAPTATASTTRPSGT